MPETKNWLIPEETHKAIVEGIVNHLGFDRALSYELDDEGKMYSRYGRGIDPRDSSYSDGRVPDPGEIFDWAIKEGKEQIVLDPASDPRCNPEKVKRDNTKPFVVVPVEKNGKVRFVVTANNWERGVALEGEKVSLLKIFNNTILGEVFQVEMPEEPIVKEETFLNVRFVNLAREFRSYLLSVKKISDEFDKYFPAEKEQVFFINAYKQNLFKVLDDYFDKISTIIKKFNKVEYVHHQKYFQHLLTPLFDISPYNKRVYDKPLGYAGDYIVMLYIYENGYEGDSTYAKLIHRYSMNIPAAVANRNRRFFYKKRISEVMSRVKNPKIASIASGPIVEIIELIRENPSALNAEFTCLDFEGRAINYAKKKVRELELEINKNINIKFINANMITLLKGKDLTNILSKQDFIYSSGLIDYFTDKIASKLVENLFESLNDNGLLIVGNVSAANPSRAYIEFLGEWIINHRDETQMLNLAKGIIDAKTIELGFEESTRMNIYLIIRK